MVIKLLFKNLSTFKILGTFTLVYERTAGSAQFFCAETAKPLFSKIIKKAVLSLDSVTEQSITQPLRIMAWRLFC